MNMVDILKLKASQGTPQTDGVADQIASMNFSDYVLENLQLKNELDTLRYAIHNSIEAYERQGEVTDFEGQPLIYAQVLLDLGDMIK